mgnify:CR=1 FL=1
MSNTQDIEMLKEILASYKAHSTLLGFSCEKVALCAAISALQKQGAMIAQAVAKPVLTKEDFNHE